MPVILITGFLGSGKTTLLQAWAEAQPTRRMMFLVNDLSNDGVDADRMRRVRPDTHAVVGGSIFCECKAADFLRMLTEDVMPAHQANPLDLLIVETSGIADPMAIGTLIAQAGFGEALSVRNIITVIAPAPFLRSVGRLPVVDAQIQAADTVVLNKTDTATEAVLQECEANVIARNPSAYLLRSQFGQGVPLDLETRLPPLPSQPLGKCSALAYSSLQVRPRLFTNKDVLEARLTALPESVLRVKGKVWTAEGPMDLDVTPDTRTLVPTTEENTPYSLVFIGDKASVAELKKATEGFCMRPALIACDVFREELEALHSLPELAETVWLPMGLHDRPAELKTKVQAEIDRLEANPGITEILMLYGLCGNGTAGLYSTRCPLIIPRAHDCIAFLLGSNARHREIQSACVGTYFYAPGWIRERRVPGPDREAWIRKEYAERFDEEMIDELVEADTEAFAHYEKALFIQTPAAADGASYCQRCAAHLGWDFESTEADTGWLHRLLHGPYPDHEFVVLQPGNRTEPSADEQILRVVPL